MSVCVQRLQKLRKVGALRSLFAESPHSVAGRRIVVDFSSPNIAKQFHVGNLRSTLIGHYIDQVHRLLGAQVVSVNYVGDWGTQFALIAAYWPKMRPSEQYWNSLNGVEKIRALMDCYVVANKMFKNDESFRELVHETFLKMEKSLCQGSNCPEMQLWQDVRDISHRHLEQFYAMLSIHFNKWMYESNEVQEAHKVVDDLVQKGLLVKNQDGQLIMDIAGNGTSKNNNQRYLILQKSNQTSLYLSREIASILSRHRQFEAEKYIYVVDRTQKQHFESLKMILERAGYEDLSSRIEHVPYGRVHGLSTRHGKTEAVGEIIERGSQLALDFMRSSKTSRIEDGTEVHDVSRTLCLSAIVFNDLKRARNSEYEFSFQNAFALNQNNSVLLQLRHSRLCSIEEQNKGLADKLDSCSSFPTADYDDDVARLVTLLDSTSKTLRQSADSREACRLTLFLVHLARASGTVTSKLKVKDQPEEVAIPRLLLFSAVRNVLAEGMMLLGVQPVRRM